MVITHQRHTINGYNRDRTSSDPRASTRTDSISSPTAEFISSGRLRPSATGPGDETTRNLPCFAGKIHIIPLYVVLADRSCLSTPLSVRIPGSSSVADLALAPDVHRKTNAGDSCRCTYLALFTLSSVTLLTFLAVCRMSNSILMDTHQSQEPGFEQREDGFSGGCTAECMRLVYAAVVMFFCISHPCLLIRSLRAL